MAFTYTPYKQSSAVTDLANKLKQYDTYKQSDAVNQASAKLADHEANQKSLADWNGGQYKQSLDDALNKISNREKFTYDLNGDALYQQYKDQYINKGKMAMMDTMGQAAALTGGYGNSYAQTVGNQAYNSYLQNLNDIVPQLYQMAYDKYNNEGQDLYNQYNLYSDAYNRDYNEYKGEVDEWTNTRNYLRDVFQNERDFDRGVYDADRTFYQTMYQKEREYDYNLYSDAYDRALKEYQLALAEASGGGGGGGGGRGRSGGGGGGNNTPEGPGMNDSNFKQYMQSIYQTGKTGNMQAVANRVSNIWGTLNNAQRTTLNNSLKSWGYA